MTTRSAAKPLLICLSALLATACASAGDGPSLQPRPGEAIDPRLPVEDRSASLPASSDFVRETAAVRQRAEAAAGRADAAIEAAAKAVASAGATGSESWIAAQQLVSAAVAERAPFTAALGDLDALLAARVRGGGRLVSQDLLAHQQAGEALTDIDRRQRARLDSFERQLQR